MATVSHCPLAEIPLHAFRPLAFPWPPQGSGAEEVQKEGGDQEAGEGKSGESEVVQAVPGARELEGDEPGGVQEDSDGEDGGGALPLPLAIGLEELLHVREFLLEGHLSLEELCPQGPEGGGGAGGHLQDFQEVFPMLVE